MAGDMDSRVPAFLRVKWDGQDEYVAIAVP